MKAQAAESKAYIEAQQSEEIKLLKIISEADAERVRQKKELDQVISERDILGEGRAEILHTMFFSDAVKWLLIVVNI